MEGMTERRVEAEIEDILMDVTRFTKKVDKDSSVSIKKYIIHMQELMSRLENIAKAMDYLS